MITTCCGGSLSPLIGYGCHVHLGVVVVEVPVEGLGDAGQELWASIHAERSVSGPHKPLVLNACRIADNLERISGELAVSGLTTVNARGDVVANPLLVEHRQQLATMRQVLQSLGIEKLLEVVKESSFKDQLAEARKAREAAKLAVSGG